MIKKCLAFTMITHLAMVLKKFWHATKELFQTYDWQVGSNLSWLWFFFINSILILLIIYKWIECPLLHK